MKPVDFLSRLREINNEKNTQGADCINRVKDFTQFVQLPTGANKFDFLEVEATKQAADDDDRRTCCQCGNLSVTGACAVAKPGGLVSANRGYRPPADTPQRCIGFLSLPTDPDQRTGAQRWPGL